MCSGKIDSIWNIMKKGALMFSKSKNQTRIAKKKAILMKYWSSGLAIFLIENILIVIYGKCSVQLRFAMIKRCFVIVWFVLWYLQIWTIKAVIWWMKIDQVLLLNWSIISRNSSVPYQIYNWHVLWLSINTIYINYWKFQFTCSLKCIQIDFT